MNTPVSSSIAAVGRAMAFFPPDGVDPILFDPQANHFARLGLPLNFAVDREQLESQYLARASAVHPDRHAQLDEAGRRQMLLASTLVNEAYRVLREPVRRAEYMVLLGGIDLASSDPVRGAPLPSQTFLLEVLEQREARESQGDAADSLEQLEQACDEALARAVNQLSRGQVREAALALVERRYLVRLRDEIAGET